MSSNSKSEAPDTAQPPPGPAQGAPADPARSRSKAEIAADHTAEEAARNAGGGSPPADKAPG
ncbi:hypothetical protein [Teichococcus vastitatis]|uniref:Uncharacterized protein n=1 Tax=Teichococcus vastitatis TaxID=2307076 RepID=A0ABS9W355_9PROT|nr:hypothetical protein [Pseudoroseomonas vastitatis]MCI0753724.1 hypothetical protein [Pseudoroseomonas vastitatis]